MCREDRRALRASRAALGLVLATVGLARCGDAPVPEKATPTGPPHEAASAAAPTLAGEPATGLWVLCEGSQRVLEDLARIDALIDAAGRLGATDLFVQVYRGGRAWFDSSRADAEPYRALRERMGRDPLQVLIERAHAADLRVHAWVNVLNLASQREPPILAALGRDAVLMDKQGRSILDYPELDVPPPDRRYYRMGTPAVWLDPAAPGVAAYLAATFAELLTHYPELDGLHLDYIRYPGVLPFSPGSRFGVGLDFGYGEPTRARFREETGLEAPLGDSLRNANAWDDWRRDQVTRLVATIRGAARAVRPDVLVSAAVGSYAERVYLSEGQDWLGWLDDGLVEFAVPMVYTRDDRLFRYMTERFTSVPNADRIWIGQGSWLFAKQPEAALAQLRLARAGGSAGVVLFSYDSIVDSPELMAALVAEPAE